jgi:hypothetical protein
VAAEGLVVPEVGETPLQGEAVRRHRLALEAAVLLPLLLVDLLEGLLYAAR